MKKIRFFAGMILLTFAVNAYGQTGKGDKVCGIYYAADPVNGEGSQILIYKNKSGKYEGRIIWMQIPNKPNGEPRRDAKCPDADKRNQPIVGLVIVKNFVYNENDDQWQNGTIYDPASGNSYRGYMKLEADGKTLKVRGYLGFSLLGKTVIWTRETEERK